MFARPSYQSWLHVLPCNTRGDRGRYAGFPWRPTPAAKRRAPASSRRSRPWRCRAEFVQGRWSQSSDHCSRAERRSLRRAPAAAVQVRAPGVAIRRAPAGLDETVGKTDPFGLLARHAAAGQNHVHRPALTDQARQPDGAEIHERHAEAPAVHAEVASRAATLRSHHSASSRPPATAWPSTAAINRLAEHEPRRPHRPIAAFQAMAAMAGCRLLEIVAGAERARRPVRIAMCCEASASKRRNASASAAAVGG